MNIYLRWLFRSHLNSLFMIFLDGTFFEVKDPLKLEQEVLPKYFRHGNFIMLDHLVADTKF
jgi:hypothetical protein